MAQKRMTSLLEEEVVTNPNTGAQDVDVVMEARQPQSNTGQPLSQPSATPAVSNAPEGMKIKTNYVPKCKSCNSSHSTILIKIKHKSNNSKSHKVIHVHQFLVHSYQTRNLLITYVSNYLIRNGKKTKNTQKAGVKLRFYYNKVQMLLPHLKISPKDVQIFLVKIWRKQNKERGKRKQLL